MEEIEEFDENMLATCNFFDKERQEIIQIQAESITLATFMDMDQLFQELKLLVNAISEFDLGDPASVRKGKWPVYEIFDDGRAPLTITFLFQNRLNTYNSDGSVNENSEDTEYVYPMIVVRVFDTAEIYYEPITDDIHEWMGEKYEELLSKANVNSH